MIQKLVQLALSLRWVMLLIALGLVAGGLSAYKQLDIEAYPNPVPPLVEVITQPNYGWSAEEGGALRHGAPGDRPRGHARARPRALAVALRAQRREVLLQVGHQLPGGAAGGAEPALLRDPLRPVRSRQISPWNTPSARCFPLPARGQGLLPPGSEDRRGLGAGAPVQAGARRHRRGELRRRDQAVPGQGRPQPAARPRGDAAAGDDLDHQRQPERGRPAPHHRRAGVQRARHRAHPHRVHDIRAERLWCSPPRARPSASATWPRWSLGYSHAPSGIVGQADDDPDIVQGIVLHAMLCAAATPPRRWRASTSASPSSARTTSSPPGM